MNRNPSRFRAPWLTLALVGVNVAWYLARGPRDPADVDALVRAGAKVNALVLDLGQLWRLAAANVVHKDALHLVTNMLLLATAGAFLENAYRRLDCAALLAIAGLSTMGASLWLSDGISAGASGLVFACLSAVTVFAIKHRRQLPPRYRRILTEAGVPLALVFLGLGWTSAGIDQAAHAGGLLAGLVVAPLLPPRLGGEPARRPTPWALGLLGALLLLLVLGEALAAAYLPPLRVERDDGFGISVALPRTWRRGANRLGKLAFSNGLPGYGRATFAAEAIMTGEAADATAHARRFIAESIAAAAAVSPLEPASVSGHAGVKVRASYEEQGSGATELRAWFVPRGELLYQLVFTYPAAFPEYARVVDDEVRRIELSEPRALREARARALLFPGAPWALGGLGEMLRRLGEPGVAAEVLRPAVREEPSAPALREQLALSLLQAGQVDEGCQVARDALLYTPERPATLEVQARCELARSNPKAALERLEEAARLAPGDERLRQAAAALRAALQERPH